ncbi:MAG: amino acid permease [bacterium]
MKKLDRSLGLLSICSIACGAMLSGIFVLPSHAAYIGGPAVYLAFLLAGLLFVPAALSKAEMATALPESGGDYIFIDRALGPMVSTITGLGTWLSLVLKSAFALAGLSAYLLLLVPVAPTYARMIAAGFALFLIAINCLGVKKSGQLQTVLVIISMTVLVLFVERGIIELEREYYHPLFQKGFIGFLSATAFVFVSYAGVTKIASAVEEVKNPGKNIPWGIVLSLTIMTFLYTAVTNVVVGVIPPGEHGKSAPLAFQDAPLSYAALQFAGNWGMTIMAVVAVLALVSMANAGLLASSRYPFAMSRYNQLPDFFSDIHDRFSTPVYSILLTGGALVFSILFLPVVDLAKLASAFLLIVFSLVNFSLIVFRESNIEWYRPEFKSPLYPYLQFFGIFTSLALIGFMGTTTALTSLGLIAVGLVWHVLFVRPRTKRKGALFQTAAEQKEISVYRDVSRQTNISYNSVIVPFFEFSEDDILEFDRRVHLASSLVEGREQLDILLFNEVPDQTLLQNYEPDTDVIKLFEERIETLEEQHDNLEFTLDTVVTHNARSALLSHAEQKDPHWIVFGWMKRHRWQNLIGIKKWWLEDLNSDLAFLKNKHKVEYKDIVVLTEPGVYDGEIINAAENISRYENGKVSFVYGAEDPSEADAYLEEMQKLSEIEADLEQIDSEDFQARLEERLTEADLFLTGDFTNGFSNEVLDNVDFETLIDNADCNSVRIRGNLNINETVRRKRQRYRESSSLRDIISKSQIYPKQQFASKDELFQWLGEQFSSLSTLDASTIVDKLHQREAIQNTYTENGIAFPHAIISGLSETKLLVAVLEDSIEYGDRNQNADIIIATVGPPTERESHLRVITSFAELFISRDMKEDWKEADTPEEIMITFGELPEA